jgi:hypothetical protein
VAAPKLQGAVEGLAPKVDTARDTIVDTLLPRVAEAIAAVAAASAAAKEGASDAADRSSDAFAVLKGDAVAKRPRRKGRLLLFVTLAAAAAAAVAAFRKSAPREDPWATPLDDPYTAPATGRDSSVSATDKVHQLADAAKEKAGEAKDKVTSRGRHASDATADPLDPAAEDSLSDELTDPLSTPAAAGSPESTDATDSTSGTSGSGAGQGD